MKLEVRQEDLERGLAAVRPALPSGSRYHANANLILVSAGEGTLDLLAGDGETIEIGWSVPASVEDGGDAAARAVLLSEFVSLVQPGVLGIEIGAQRVVVNYPTGTASIPARDADRFERLQSAGNGMATTLAIGRSDLQRAVDCASSAAAGDDSRPALHGAHLSVAGSRLRMAAADGFRLAVHETELPGADADCSTLVPLATLNALGRILAALARPAPGEGDDGAPAADAAPVSVSFGGDGEPHLHFDFGTATISSAVAQAQFPEYETLIPEPGGGTIAEVGIDAFRRAVRSISVIARMQNGIVRMSAAAGGDGAAGGLQLRSHDGENTSEELVEALVGGKNVETAVNYRYLEDALRTVHGDRAVVAISAPREPISFRAAGENAPGCVHVVMPMSVP